MQAVDFIINADVIVTVNENNQVLTEHALIINDGKIIDILPQSETTNYQTNNQIHKNLLSPGFINMHTHAAMNVFKGLACDKPLASWLDEYIWPAEHKLASPEMIHAGTELALAEMIKSGITCFNDMYFYADTTASLCEQHGMRCALGLIVLDFPTPWAETSSQYFDKVKNLYHKFNNLDLITPVLAPHAPYTVGDKSLTKVRNLADKFNLPVHMHIHESQYEIAQSLKEFNVRPLKRLENLGFLDLNLIAVHMVHLNQDEIKCLKQSYATVVHCPKSNLKLASGIADIKTLNDNGINLSLGTDGAASNNNLDLLAEAQYACLLAKGQSLDATAITAGMALRMATINGAKALGLENKIGSLEIGKQADIVAFNTDDINCQPCFNPFSQIIYSCNKSQISDVWIAGKQLLKDGELLTIDEQELLLSAQWWQEKILKTLQS